MTTTAEHLKHAGQRLFVGFDHATIPYEFRRFVMEAQPAGFILFSRNVIDPEQVRELNGELAAMVGSERPAFLCVDQEGGTVQRIRETAWPSMTELASHGDPELTRKVIHAMNHELRAMGFDLNFAPVTDVNSNPANPVIGKRAFGDSPESVIPHLQAALRGMREAHIISCAKHWPGHGDTHEDSHLTLPTVDKDQAQLEALETRTFDAALAAGVDSVMTAHVMYPKVDPLYPATMSQTLLGDWLRKRRGFNGLVFSDDLTMLAIRDRWTVAEQVEQGSRAGVDVFLVGNELDLQWGVLEALIHAQETDTVQAALAKESYERGMALRRKAFLNRPPMPPIEVVGSAAYKLMAAQIT